MNRRTLDCQTCGDPIRELDAREAQLVADRPENFIVDCRLCIRERDGLRV